MKICLTFVSFDLLQTERIIDYTNSSIFNLQKYFVSDIMLRVN